jgi:hypothetical protein
MAMNVLWCWLQASAITFWPETQSTRIKHFPPPHERNHDKFREEKQMQIQSQQRLNFEFTWHNPQKPHALLLFSLDNLSIVLIQQRDKIHSCGTNTRLAKFELAFHSSRFRLPRSGCMNEWLHCLIYWGRDTIQLSSREWKSNILAV